MDSLRVPRFLILFCAVSWMVVQQSMQSTSPHELSTDVQHVGSSSTPAEVLDMGDGQTSEGADTVDHLRTQVDQPKEEQKKRRVKRSVRLSRLLDRRGNRGRHSQTCREGGPRRFCETTGHCGWKNLNFEILVMDEGRDWAVQLENGKGWGFLKSELACHTGGETNCLRFDYKMDEPNMDELLVFLDDQETKKTARLWRTRAVDEPRVWNTAYIAIKSRTRFQVEIRAIRCDPEQKSLSRVALRNILYRQGQCVTAPAVEPPYDSPCEASSPGSHHTSAVTSPVSSTSDSTEADWSVDDDDNDDDDKKGIVIAVVVSCAFVVMALLVMAIIVCWRRRSRKRTISAPSAVMPSGAQSQDDPPDARNIPVGNMAADNIPLEGLDATGRRQAPRDAIDDMPDYDDIESSVHVYSNTGGNVTRQSTNAVSGLERGAHRHVSDDAQDYEDINDRVYDLPGKKRNAQGGGRRQNANTESQHIYVPVGRRNVASDGVTPSCQVL